MRRFFRSLRVLLPALLLTACTPARTGVIGTTLTTNVKPVISITGVSPLLLRDHGRLLAEAGPPDSRGTASLSFDYAFFAAEQEHNGFAYAAIIRITNDTFWRFQPPTPFDEAFNDIRTTVGGISWSEQLLRSSSKGDWAGGIWEDLGGEIPDFWLVRRRVTHLNDTTRAVIDYREPWPEAIRTVSGGTLIVTDDGYKALQAFLARADAAFLVEKKAGEFDANAPKTEVKKARIPLNSAKLIGTVIQVSNA